jgi:hypothetical protein
MSQPAVGAPQGQPAQPWVRVDLVEEYARSLIRGSEALDRLAGEKGLVQRYLEAKVTAAAKNALRDVHDHGYPEPGRGPHQGVLKLRAYLANHRPGVVHPETSAISATTLGSQPWARTIPTDVRPALDAYIREEVATAGQQAQKVSEAWAEPLNHPRDQLSHEQVQGVAELDARQRQEERQQAQQMLSGTPQYTAPQAPREAPQVASQGEGWVPNRTQQQSQQY